MTENKPVPVPRREHEASRLIRSNSSERADPITDFEVKPKSKTHFSLGDFTVDKPPVGFSLEISPANAAKDVVAQITKLSAAYDEYELALHVTNNSDEMVSIEVQQL